MPRKSRPWFRLDDWFWSLFGAPIAHWLLFFGAVAYVYVVGFVRDLSGIRLLLLLPGLGAMLLGLWGLLGDLKERARLRRAAEMRDYFLNEMVSDLHLRSLLKGKPIPAWSLVDQKLIFDIEEVAFIYGETFRVIVRHPSGRVRAITTTLKRHLLSGTGQRGITYEGRVTYPDDFGPQAPAVEPGNWEVIWKSEYGFKQDAVRYPFEFSDLSNQGRESFYRALAERVKKDQPEGGGDDRREAH